MKNAPDFGMKNIDWGNSNLNQVKLMAAEYQKRLDATQRGYADLESKSRWVFTTSLALSVGLASYLYANDDKLNCIELSAAITLNTLLFLGSMLAAGSVILLSYDSEGMTPRGLKIDSWAQFLMGGAIEEKQFHGMRIRQFARSIQTNQRSNKRKSRLLKWAVLLSTASLPISALVFLCLSVLL